MLDTRHEAGAIRLATITAHLCGTLPRILAAGKGAPLHRIDARRHIAEAREILTSLEAAMEPQTPDEVVGHLRSLVDHELGAEVVPLRQLAPAGGDEPTPPRAA